MIYLDSAATSFPKPPAVERAMVNALRTCANPGRGGHEAAMAAARTVLSCREKAGALFFCQPEQVVFTANCTHGLNIAIETLVKPGGRVLITGFEHNAVLRPLVHRKAKITIGGERVFDPADTLESWESALKKGVDAAIFTHVSNVFGYILPIEEMAALCRRYGVPFAIDAAQSAGVLPVNLQSLGADFIAMPGHKGLLGPQGTGLLLCNRLPEPLLLGGTGSQSMDLTMPDFLPERAEAGTVNVPGIAGLLAGLSYVEKIGLETIRKREERQVRRCVGGLEKLGIRVFHGDCQSGVVSFVPEGDCETVAERLARENVAVRAGLHCAPLAHKSAGTLSTGTVRVSFGWKAADLPTDRLLETLGNSKKIVNNYCYPRPNPL